MQVSKRENFKSVKIGFVAVKDVEAEGHRQCSSHAAMAMAALLLRCGYCPPLRLWLLHSSRVEWPCSSHAAMATLLSRGGDRASFCT